MHKLILVAILIGAVCCSNTEYLHLKLLGRYSNVYPAADDSSYYVSTLQNVIARVRLDTNEIDWRRVFSSNDKIDTITPFYSGLISSSRNGTSIRRWGKTGSLIWEYNHATPSTSVNSVSSDDNSIIIVHSDVTFALQGSDGHVLWTAPVGGHYAGKYGDKIVVFKYSDGKITRSMLRSKDGAVVDTVSHNSRSIDMIKLSGDIAVFATTKLYIWRHEEASPHSIYDGGVGDIQVYTTSILAATAESVIVYDLVGNEKERIKVVGAKLLPSVAGYYSNDIKIIGGPSIKLPRTDVSVLSFIGDKFVLMTPGGLVLIVDTKNSRVTYRPDGLGNAIRANGYHMISTADELLNRHGIIDNFLHRIKSDLAWTTSKPSSKDIFNIHQGIVIMTASAVAALDSKNGSIIWWNELHNGIDMIMMHEHIVVFTSTEVIAIRTHDGVVIKSNAIENVVAVNKLPNNVDVAVLHTNNTFSLWNHGERVHNDSLIHTLRGVVQQDDSIVAYADGEVVYKIPISGRIIAPSVTMFSTPSRKLGRGSYAVTVMSPNTLVVTSQANSSVTVSTIDTATGRVLDRAIHYNSASNGVPAVLCGDHVVYSVFTNAGASEIHTREYDLINDVVTPLNSAFTVPYAPTVLTCTYSQRDITRHDVIAATSSGQIIRIRSRLLDPHRPKTPVAGDANAIPFSTNIKYDPLSVLSQNSTIEGTSILQVLPTSLESTSLVLAAGLDVFVAPVAPSGTFDMLSESFAYDMVYGSVIAATIGLVVVYIMMKRSGK